MVLICVPGLSCRHRCTSRLQLEKARAALWGSKGGGEVLAAFLRKAHPKLQCFSRGDKKVYPLLL